MKKLLIPTIGLLLGNTELSAQAMGNSNQNPYNYNSYDYRKNSSDPISNAGNPNKEEVNITVNGLMNVLAANYVAVFNLLQVGETAENTDNMMNNRIYRLKQELSKRGIDTGNVATDMICFVPKYSYTIDDSKLFSKTYNEIPEGFELQKNILVHYTNSAMLDDIVTAAASAEIYDLVKVNYSIPNLQRSLDSLRNLCIAEIKGKTKSFEALGIKLDTLKKTFSDNFNTVYPAERYSSYTAYARASLDAVKKRTPVIRNIEKPVSRYYDPVDYNKYDLVVNPVISEPTVQLSYSITVKYYLKTEEVAESKPDNVYFLISPSGDLKQLPLN